MDAQFPRARILLQACAAWIVFSAAIPAIAGHDAGQPVLIDTRIVAAPGRLDDPAVRAHVDHASGLGFNAVWVHSGQAGRWAAGRAPDGPALSDGFVEFVDWCRLRRLRVFVVISPTATTAGAFRFTDADARRRLRRFVRLLRKAGVRDFVVAFDDMPTRLTELNDVLAYGTSTAPAHLELVRRLARSVPRRGSVWFLPSAYCDAHLGDGTGRYAAPLLAGLDRLPRRVGIVWTGSEVVSASITRADIETTRRRLGGRRILLFDNFPNDGDFRGLATGTVLGPLRQRDPGLPGVLEAYLTIPNWNLGAARLPLATVADWLRAPDTYDPDRSALRARRALAGDDGRARAALDAQAEEWGGWVGQDDYRAAWAEDVDAVANRLDDSAYVQSWTSTVHRYPERMRALGGMSDGPFREDLLRLMRRRLAIARAVPLVAAYSSNSGRRGPEADEILRAIETLRAATPSGDARRALDRLLELTDAEVRSEP